MCGGVLVVALLQMPAWFSVVCVFHVIEVVFGFAVDHHHGQAG